MSATNRKQVPFSERLAFSAAEAGSLIGASESLVRRLVAEGKLARVPHTERLLIPRAELERFVTSGVAA